MSFQIAGLSDASVAPASWPAALYARVSTDAQARDGTVVSQLEALHLRAAQDGAAVGPELCFVDDGCSGSTLVRPALERLRDAAAAGRFRRLYVLSPDRLARNFAHQAVLVEEFKRLGVELVLLNRAVSDTPEDALLLQVQGVLAEYERAKILERCRRGRLHAARSGSLAVIGKAAYGYRYVSKADAGGQAQLNVQLEEAAVVREIFAWVARDRLSLGQVSRQLAERGVPSPTGKPQWRQSVLSRMLSNPLYKGQAAFGKSAAGPWDPPVRERSALPRRPRTCRRTPPEQWLLLAAPALVDAELFAAAAAQREENRRRWRPSASPRRMLLSGLAVCGCCGRAYVGGRSCAGHYGYYRCTGPTGQCPNRSVRTTLVEQAVWQDVRSLLSDPQRIQEEYRRRLQRPAAPAPDAGAEARRLQVGIERLIDAYQQGLLEKSQFEPRAARSRQRIEQLRQEHQVQAQQQLQDHQMRMAMDHLASFARQVECGLADADDQTRRRIMLTLVRRVEINPQDIRIVYRVGPVPFADTPTRGYLQDPSARCTAAALRVCGLSALCCCEQEQKEPRRGGWPWRDCCQ
jgi:site-specific DNA recombinase